MTRRVRFRVYDPTIHPYLPGVPWCRIIPSVKRKKAVKHYRKVGLDASGYQLNQAAQRLVRKRLEAVEDWIALARQCHLPDGRTVGPIDAWTVLCQIVLTGKDEQPVRHENTARAPAPERLCQMPDGTLIHVDRLPDNYGLVTPPAGNGNLRPAIINGELAPYPLAVPLQGVHAVTRKDLAKITGDVAAEEKDFVDPGRRERATEMEDGDDITTLGRCAERIVCTRGH